MKPFGYSLHLDMYGIKPAICDDLGFCHDALVDLVKHLKMHQQSPPFIFRTPPELNPDMVGLSGWVPLIQSGISIHTLTKHGFVSFDIYTCGQLDQQEVIRFLCDRFRPDHYDEPHLLARGLEYYRQPSDAVRPAPNQALDLTGGAQQVFGTSNSPRPAGR